MILSEEVVELLLFNSSSVAKFGCFFLYNTVMGGGLFKRN